MALCGPVRFGVAPVTGTQAPQRICPGAPSECRLIMDFVVIRTFNLTNINPAALVYDPIRRVSWMFGGGAYPNPGNELWSFDAASKTWSRVWPAVCSTRAMRPSLMKVTRG